MLKKGAGIHKIMIRISRPNEMCLNASSHNHLFGYNDGVNADVSSPNTIYNRVAEGGGSRRRRRRGHDEGLPQSPSSDADDEESGVGSPV